MTIIPYLIGLGVFLVMLAVILLRYRRRVDR